MRPSAAAGPARIRQINRRAVLGHLRLHGARSRSELAAALGLSPAGVTAVVNDLLETGLIRPAAEAADAAAVKRGRPLAPLALNPDAASAIGIRLHPAGGRLVIQRAWIDYAGTVHGLAPLDGPLPADVAGLLDQTATAVADSLAAVPALQRMAGCCIAVPGVVVEGSVRLAPSLPALEQGGYSEALARRLPCSPQIQNDVNLSVLAELNRQTRLREANFAYLYIGAGVGAGIGLQGRLWEASGWAGEVGHIRIDRGGASVSFEELLGVERRLATMLAEVGQSADDLDGCAAACRSGHPALIGVINRYAAALAELVQILNAVLDLDEVIIDFPSADLFDCIRPELDRLIARQPRPVRISTPATGRDAALHGAALAALEQARARIEGA